MQTRGKTKDLVLCALFVALIAVGAFIKVPIPIMPFTLQFLFTMLAGLILGGRRGFLCVCAYIAMGLLGLPVFSEGGGLFYVLKPSFGYIIGFAAGAYVTGKLAHRVLDPGYPHLLAANFAGLVVVYFFGIAYLFLISYFYLGDPIEVWPFILYYFIPDLSGDITLCLLAAMLGKRLIPLMKTERVCEI